MVTPSPKRNYAPKGFAHFRPTTAQVNALMAAMEKVLGKPASPAFRHRMGQLITLLRTKVDIEREAPHTPHLLAELEQTEKALAGVVELLNLKMSDQLRWEFNISNMRGNLSGENDPRYQASKQLTVLLRQCADIRARLKTPAAGEEGPLDLKAMRLIAAEELARALEREGHKPTTTRQGKFETCLKALYDAVPCRIKGKVYAFPAAADLHTIVLQAVKGYKTKPAHPLLGEGGQVPAIPG